MNTSKHISFIVLLTLRSTCCAEYRHDIKQGVIDLVLDYKTGANLKGYYLLMHSNSDVIKFTVHVYLQVYCRQMLKQWQPNTYLRMSGTV